MDWLIIALNVFENCKLETISKWSNFQSHKKAFLYTYFKKHCRREWRMAVVERKLQDWKELWFPYFNVLLQTPKKMKPLPLNAEEYRQTIWLAIKGRHCIEPASWKILSINIQYPHFFSVGQSLFDNWHWSFSPTTNFEIAVYWSTSHNEWFHSDLRVSCSKQR